MFKSRPFQGPAIRAAWHLEIVLAVVCASGVYGAECLQWVQRTNVGSYGQRVHHAMAYDIHRGVTVFFGGEVGREGEQEYFNDTQEYDGTNWIRISVSTVAPPRRSFHAMAYDRVRRQVVLAGGLFKGEDDEHPRYYSDTWVYTSTGPGTGAWSKGGDLHDLRGHHGMTFDSVTKRVILHGGLYLEFPSGGGFGRHFNYDDTLEWNGLSWSLFVAKSPFPMDDFGFAFDEARGVAVAFGPSNHLEYRPGAGWADLGPTGISGRDQAAVAFDDRRKRVVAVGGNGNHPKVGEEAYEYAAEEEAWLVLPPLPPGKGRAGAKMVYDSRRGVMVLTGGAGGGAENASEGGRYSDTWELVPALTITKQPASITNQVCGNAEFSVAAAGAAPLYYQWRLDGKPLINDAYFTGVDTPNLAINGLRHAHTGRYEVEVKDSCGATNIITSETASLTIEPAAEWGFRTTNGPPARFGHAMVYDHSRGVTLLFGGQTSSSAVIPLNDLWAWNGAWWTELMPNAVSNGWTFSPNTGWRVAYADRPVRRTRFAMAHDTQRARTIVFGGFGIAPDNTAVMLRDLWEWDGVRWLFRGTNGPSARYYPSMAFDQTRRRTVLYGGASVLAPGEPADADVVWEWDGDRWHANLPPRSPSALNNRIQSRMAYDAHRGVIVFGPTSENYSHWSFWDWDGEWWSDFPVNHSRDPIVSALHGTSHGAFAYDSAQRRTVWFGGINNATHNVNAVYDGRRWSLATNSLPPGPRMESAMAYDPNRQVMVMFGGNVDNSDRGATNDTWELAAVEAPLINDHPASQYRKLGETATFTVNVIGPGSLSFQWFHTSANAVRPLPETGATLTIASVRSQDAGRYRVVVKGSCGETQSRSAVLTLDPRLQIFSETNSTTLAGF